MGHTPGPWTVGDVQWMMNKHSGLGYSFRPINAGSWELAQVWEDDCDHEMAANVRLIAAAPELLERLRECVTWLEDYYDAVSMDDDQQQHLEAARAAIRKAEGGE